MADSVQPQASAQLQMPSVPKFSASNFTVVGTDKEIVILLGSSTVGIRSDGVADVVTTPSAQVSMSILAGKELLVLLRDAVTGVEADIGIVTSDFLRGRAENG